MRRACSWPLAFVFLVGCHLPPPQPEQRPLLEAFRDPGSQERFLGLQDPSIPPERRLVGLIDLLAEDSGNLAVAWAIADLGRQEGLAEDATRALQTLVAPLRESALARLEGSMERREQLLRDALHMDRDYYPALYLRGKLRMEQGRPDEAGVALERCLAVYPGWPPALFELARLRQVEGRHEEAVRLLQAYLEARPWDREARLLRALLLLQPLGELRAASREIERLRTFFAGDPEVALLEAGLVALRGRSSEAAVLYEALLETPAVRGQAAFNLGILRLHKLDDRAGAVEALRLFLDAPPGSSALDLFDRFRARIWLLELEEQGIVVPGGPPGETR